MTVNYGLIGYGAWGSHHAQAIQALPSARLAAVAAFSADSAERAARELGVEAYADYTQLLARDDIDVVDIVVPNDVHHEIALRTLQAGKHILLEKPMALTVEQCQELIDEADRRNLIIQIGFELRFSPLWGEVQKWIEQGKIGDLKTAYIHLSRFPYRNGSGGWRKDAKRVGSWILEEPVHFYDLARWYFGPRETPVSLYALGNSREARLEDERLYENITTGITFSEGGYAVINQTLAAYGHHLSGEFIGTKGVLKARWSGSADRIRDPQFQLEYYDGAQLHELPMTGTPGELFELEYQLAEFTEVIANRGQPSVSGEDGLWAVKLSLAAQQSIENKQIISFGASSE